MINLTLMSNKGKIHINSGEVKDTLCLRPDFDYVQDISNTINQDQILVFDCQLTGNKFDIDDIDIEELLEELSEEIDESYFNILFEDIRAYLKDISDEIEADLQENYALDNIRCYFDIYNINQEFTDFKFVFLVSFKDIKISSLANLAKIVSKRQLAGASKFYS
ncbi:hypothetical protein [Metaclostridioides mangenotii]|uniref:hypothetical protein n=1 Tax=Metaclostridioides mangenotii TaxID=1540 RepID=UPI0004649DED|nr:hypothetical protein [Clostridioides mangenotii]